ncbi:MAG: DUF4157 domain-containing protein [Deltaproteobacteria bacterium]
MVRTAAPPGASGAGAALPRAVRADFEPRLDADLGAVRIYLDAPAAALAHAEGARAFAYGSHVVFGQGAFAPHTTAGRFVLAHELAHTVDQIGSAPRVQRIDVPSPGELLDRAVAAGSDLVDEGAEVLDDAGEALGDLARGAGNWFFAIVESRAPELVRFLRTNPLETIKAQLWDAVDGWLGGFLSRVRDRGIVGALRETFGELPGRISAIVQDLRRGECDSLFLALRELADFGGALFGPTFEELRAFLTDAQSLFSETYDKFVSPHVETIREIAGELWREFTEAAEDFWEDIEPLRTGAAEAWAAFRDAFDIAWDSGAGAVAWVRDLVAEAWAELREELGPLAYVLAGIGVALSMLTPFGPIVLIGVGVPALWEALTWVYDHWDELEVVITAREILHDTILPALNDGLEALDGFVATAQTWLQDAIVALRESVVRLAATLGLTPELELLVQFVQSLVQDITDLATFVETTMNELFTAVRAAAREVYAKTRPLFGLVAAIVLFPVYPFLLPTVLAGWAWRLTPDCLKLPVVDFALDVMAEAIRGMPEHTFFGEAWTQARQQILMTLEDVRALPEDERIAASDRIAKLMTLEDVAWIGRLLLAAAQAPAQFVPQLQMELVGFRTDQPLDFERTSVPDFAALDDAGAAIDAGGALPELESIESRILAGAPLRDGDITVDEFPQLDFEPELVASFREGMEFGERPDERGTVASLAEDLRAVGLEGDVPIAADEALDNEDAPPEGLTHEERTEWRLQRMMAVPVAQSTAEGRPICSEPDPSERAARDEEIPEEAKIGPLTQTQRARYLLNRMGAGLSAWFDCNKHWLIPSIVAVVVGLIALEILTEGAVTAALPPLMELLTVALVGIAAVRSGFYMARYLQRAITGNVAGAAEDLARSFVVPAVEIVFALLFNIGAVIKTARAAFRGTIAAARGGVRGVTRAAAATARRGMAAARRGVEGAVDSARTVGRLGRLGTRTAIGNVRRIPGAILREGRLVMTGLRGGFGRGVRSIRDLARRLWRRVRFRRFRVRRVGARWIIEGYINPWVPLGAIPIQRLATTDAEIDHIVAQLNASGLLTRGRIAGAEGETVASLLDDIAGRAKAGEHGALGELATLERRVLRDGERIEILRDVQGADDLRFTQGGRAARDPRIRRPRRTPDFRRRTPPPTELMDAKTAIDPPANWRRWIQGQVNSVNDQVRRSRLIAGNPGAADLQLFGDAALSLRGLPPADLERFVRGVFNPNRGRSLQRVTIYADGITLMEFTRDAAGQVTRVL